MSQNYIPFSDKDIPAAAPAKLNTNFEAVATDWGGAAFPTENLFPFMMLHLK